MLVRSEMARGALLAAVLLSLLVSAEFRLALQSDGRTRFAFLVGISLVTGRSEEKISLPDLAVHSPTALSLIEAMYLRNRLEEILDDDEEEDAHEEGTDLNHDGTDETFMEVSPFFE